MPTVNEGIPWDCEKISESNKEEEQKEKQLLVSEDNQKPDRGSMVALTTQDLSSPSAIPVSSYQLLNGALSLNSPSAEQALCFLQPCWESRRLGGHTRQQSEGGFYTV